MMNSDFQKVSHFNNIRPTTTTTTTNLLSVLCPLPWGLLTLWLPADIQVDTGGVHPHTKGLSDLLASVRLWGAGEGGTEELLPELLLDLTSQCQAVGAGPAGGGEQQGVHHRVVKLFVLVDTVTVDG